MVYLKFNKDELVNLEYSLKREVLATNRAGGYMSSTIICCNTRKYHGLLIMYFYRHWMKQWCNTDKLSIWASINTRVIMNPADTNIL